MKYCYFVSYSHHYGFGMIKIYRHKKIKTFDDVLSLREAIKDESGLDVVILNWKQLED